MKGGFLHARTNNLDLIFAGLLTFAIFAVLSVISLADVRWRIGGSESVVPLNRVTLTPIPTPQPTTAGERSSVVSGAEGARLVAENATRYPNPTSVPFSWQPVVGPTPTPIRVVVSTQKRSWVYLDGPATYVRRDAFAPLPLSSFPRPTNDNGRGLHWFPTTFQTRAVVDRFVPELKAMRIRWVVIVQGMDDWNILANDYLIDRLAERAEGLMVVMRIDRQVGAMDWQRLGWIVARYRERGVRYVQIYNEPNLIEEWGARESPTPEQFVAYWIQAAEVVAANGGLPGFAPMSPQRDDSDLVFFQAALEELKRLKRFDLVNQMWLSIHNYGDLTQDGFFRYRRYDALVRQTFGKSLPMIITEGGLADAEQTARVITAMYQFIQNEREPYLLAFAPWLIGNAVGGGHDPRWESAAWFTGTPSQVRARNVVEQAKIQ
jgi:hypothetical protein